MSSTLEILKELQAIAEREAQGDKYAHLELLGGLQRLQNAVATPAEKMLRIRFQMYQNVCVRIAQEYGILQALVAKGRASADDLSAATKVDALLIARIMRLLTLIGIADEVGPSLYEANTTTEFTTKKGIIGDVKYYTDIVMKICSNMGPLAADRSEVDPHTHTFGMPMFPYMQAHREYGQAFEDFMTARRAATWSQWFDTFPAAERIAAMDLNSPSASAPAEVLLVDVAGGQGYWTQQFRRRLFPAEGAGAAAPPGRLIVQDQPHVLCDLSADGIETQAYDFFTPQPVRGARFYYFKQIIHNWGDEQGALILRNTAEAMDDKSTLLINDYVLPDQKAGLRAVYMDIAMMVLLSPALERTESQWKKLVESAGLKIVKIWNDDKVSEGSESIIECVKA